MKLLSMKMKVDGSIWFVSVDNPDDGECCPELGIVYPRADGIKENVDKLRSINGKGNPAPTIDDF